MIAMHRHHNPIAYAVGLTRWLSTFYLHFRYFWLLLFPIDLSVDYSENCIPLITSLADSRNILSLTLYLTIFVALLCLCVFVTFRHACYKEVLLSFSWLVLPFLPSSNIFFSPGTLLAERVLYLPSLGFCFLFSWALHTLKNRKAISKNVMVALGVAVLVLYASRTVDRNPDWRSDESIFTAALDVCPESGKVQYNVGICKERNREWDLAYERYQRAVDISKEYEHAVARLGTPSYPSTHNSARTTQYNKLQYNTTHTPNHQ